MAKEVVEIVNLEVLGEDGYGLAIYLMPSNY